MDAFRERMGEKLVLALTGLLAAITLTMMIASAMNGSYAVVESSKQLLTSLLPLIGTWIGTVLAFYYGKENLEAASKSTLDLARALDQRLKITKASDKMMPRAQIISITVPTGKSINDVLIGDVENKYLTAGQNKKNISRLLVFDETSRFIAILHKSIFYEMQIVYRNANKQSSDALTGLKMSVLLTLAPPSLKAKSYLDYISSTIAFVAADKTVADAKSAMDAVSDCQDIVITQNGDKTEAVLGWLSDVDINRLSIA